VIVAWRLDELEPTLAQVGVERPFLIASERWRRLELPYAHRWSEVPSHRVEVPEDADGILALGGGSAIDTGKYASAQADRPLVSVPTTYSGAEWTTMYGIRSPDRRMQSGGRGAHPVAIVYDVDLTIGLPRAESVGTALNALAHCAEALYVQGHNEDADAHALEGARLTGCRASSSSRGTSRRGRSSCTARVTRARRSVGRCSRSRTRWRRPSAASTGCRTGR
jgi:hypothetical protein